MDGKYGKKDAVVQIRLTEEQLAEMKNAAQKAGTSLSSWARIHLLRIAREEIRKP